MDICILHLEQPSQRISRLMSLDAMENFGFSDLPEDIGKLIFEFIAEMDEETGCSCALVSRKIKVWYVR